MEDWRRKHIAVIKPMIIREKGDSKMIRYYCEVAVLAILIVLFTASLGWCRAQHENQDVLANSKIKKNIFPKIFRDIKKTLPNQLKKCPIIVSDIKLLKAGNDSAEDWTVNLCQETRVFFVYDYSLKGFYLYIVKPKEEQFAKEKEIWNAAKKFGDEEIWQKTLFYVDEIEAMNKMGENKDTPIK